MAMKGLRMAHKEDDRQAIHEECNKQGRDKR